ncbi:MAG: hypothetical protein OMM_15063, partial [Candidatus Magnetoglobus multicellularis str. Araruama]
YESNKSPTQPCPSTILISGTKSIRLSDNYVYFIKEISDWDSGKRYYMYIVFDITTNRFLEGYSEDFPGNAEPNNIQLLINGRRWFHIAELNVITHDYSYGYGMWMSTNFN